MMIDAAGRPYLKFHRGSKGFYLGKRVISAEEAVRTDLGANLAKALAASGTFGIKS